MSFDWKSIVRTAAPTIGGLFGGPVAGVAISALAEGLLGDDVKGNTLEQKQEALEAYLGSNASPDVLEKIRKIDADFKVQMKKMDVDLESVHAGDRASARERERILNDWTPRAMAMSVTVGVFAILCGLMFIEGIPEASITLLNVMLGALSTAWISIIQYYFGSSKGSSDKNYLSSLEVNNRKEKQ